MHKLTANTDGLTEVAASQQGSTDLEIRAEQIATAAMGELIRELTYELKSSLIYWIYVNVTFRNYYKTQSLKQWDWISDRSL